MIRKSLLLLAPFALALSAQAQLSAYGMITADRMTGISSSSILQTLAPLPCSTSAAPCTRYNDSINTIGFTGGVTYDVHKFGPATLGVDLRGTTARSARGAQTDFVGSGSRIYTGLGGVRASFATPYKFLRPYVQASGGYARTNYGVLTDAVHTGTSYPNPAFPGFPTKNNLAYNAYAGIDLRIVGLLDFRAVELGYGAIQAFGTYSHTYPILSVSSGLVFHFPPRP